MQISELLNNSIPRISSVSTTPRLDAEILLCHVLGQERAFLYTSAAELTTSQIEQFNSLLNKRAVGYPIAYLVGNKAFWTLELKINENVLIPRPETELLIEIVLDKFNQNENLIVADLGTGSGAIALALAKERPHWQFYATDISEQALEVARHNAKKLHLNNIEFCYGDWLFALPSISVNLIVSNPPYIVDDNKLFVGEIMHEPRLALAAGSDGLDAYKKIIPTAKNYLSADGMIIFEHGFDQQQQVSALLLEYGFDEITSYKDLAGYGRVTSGLRRKNYEKSLVR